MTVPTRATYTFAVKFPRFALSCAILISTLWIAPARGGDEPPSLNVLVVSADLIVVGKIGRTTFVERDNDLEDISYNKTRRYTAVIATLDVNETLKGDAPSTLKFTFPKRARVKGEPVYDNGQDGVWLLRKSEKKDNEFLADEIGRYQPRERKEQIKAILARAKDKGDRNDGPK